MNILDYVYAKAKADPQRVAFPEAHDETMMRAAHEAASKGLVKPLLVGDKPALEALCAKRGLDGGLFSYVDVADVTYRDDLIERYTSLPGVLLSAKSLSRRMPDPLYFALVMEAVGDADCTLAGIEKTTGEVILAGQTIIGLAEGVSTISSIGIFDIPGYEGSEGSLLAFGDSAVCTDPDAEQLASIAISACDTVRGLLDWEPRCALLSYSTTGSSEGPLVDKVLEALKIAGERRPDLAIDGEFQLDAAINPEIAARKVKRESRVAGRANIIIWPDLNVGNIGVKLVQQFANANAYGPFLQGFKKIVSDCSRGAGVSELVGSIAISCVRAQGGSHA
jgi:phosphate acetyltransferase